MLNMMTVQKMANMKQVGKQILVDGSISIQYFSPYTRSTWEFSVDGVVVDRRYSPKTAAAYYAELKTVQREGVK
jgi:hypothetical protein